MNRSVIFALFVFTLFPAVAQQQTDTTQTLEERFTELLRRSETYQEYKVVRRSALNMFWAALSDSLSTGNAALKEALVGKMQLQQELNQSQDSLRMAQATIDRYASDEAQITFLGTRMDEGFYNTLVWSLVVALTALMLYFMLQYKRGHEEVKETRLEHSSLQNQYDTLRHKSKETQMKLKRELQTALNKLEAVERH